MQFFSSRHAIFIWCFLGLLGSLSMPASATLICYDAFDYTLHHTVVGQGVATDWPSPDQTYTTSTGVSSAASSEVSDMTPYWNLQTSGNQLQLNGSAFPGASGVYRNLGATYNTAGQDYWFSVLLQVDNNAGDGYAGISLFSDSSEALFIGQTSRATTWGVHSYRGGGIISSSVSSLNSSNVFLVLEMNGITHKGNFYVNPTSLGGSAPDTPSGTFSFADFSFNRFRAQAGSENLDVDELRFGTNYASVSPVPEVTSSFTLFGLITSGLLLRRRTKSLR